MISGRDPTLITSASSIKVFVELIRIWLIVRPIERWRERRQLRRQLKQLESGTMTSEQVQSIGRGVLKWGGGLLVGWAAAKYGLSTADAATLTTLLEGAGGGVLALAGFVLSHINHKP